jgi:hypothetical protein
MTTPEEDNLQMAMQQRWALVGLSVALFLLCLTQDGYYVEGPDPRAWASPAVLLSMGWLGVFEGVFAWLANPLLLAAWISLALGHQRIALETAAAAVAFALSFFTVDTILVNEAGGNARVTGVGAGYHLWVASMLVVVVGGGLALYPRAPRNPTAI